jgi:geranylgeranyl pyrophosphate synthase
LTNRVESWKYRDSAGQAFGYEPKPGLPDVSLSLDNRDDVEHLKDIVTTYNALEEKKEALSKSLNITVQLSQYLASHKAERKQLEEMAREETRKKPDNSKHRL